MANAPLSFAVLHELPEPVQPGLHAGGGFRSLPELLQPGLHAGGGFILLATVTHYPVSFVFFLFGPVFARVCFASKDSRTGATTPMKHWVRCSWCAATLFAL